MIFPPSGTGRLPVPVLVKTSRFDFDFDFRFAMSVWPLGTGKHAHTSDR